MSKEVNAEVLSILESINSKNSDCANTTADEDTPASISEGTADKVKKKEPIKGKPKSGRFWKTQRERFSSINKTKGLRQDFQKKTLLRLELKRTKELSKQIQQQIQEKEQERKERRRQNIKKAEENKRNSEVVQVITNTSKLKRMRKKQLRFIQKRDTNKEVEASK